MVLCRGGSPRSRRRCSSSPSRSASGCWTGPSGRGTVLVPGGSRDGASCAPERPMRAAQSFRRPSRRIAATIRPARSRSFMTVRFSESLDPVKIMLRKRLHAYARVREGGSDSRGAEDRNRPATRSRPRLLDPLTPRSSETGDRRGARAVAEPLAAHPGEFLEPARRAVARLRGSPTSRNPAQ